MNSPVFRAVLIAAIFAVVAYFLAASIEMTATVSAILVFVSALIPQFLNGNANADSSSVCTEVKTLYVGNLPYRANEGAVRALFSEHGQVHSVRLMKDKHTGKRRGFGFVEMAASDSDSAVSNLNDSEFQQRTLKVREAKERPERTNEEE